jgi:hypothetical protein
MGHSQKEGGELIKVKSGFESEMAASVIGKNNNKMIVETRLLNKTAHMFPGAHPIRRVLTRVVVTDAQGNQLQHEAATGASDFKTVTNQLATFSGDTILPGFETVDVEYNDKRDIVIQGQTPNLDSKGEPVMSQFMDDRKVDWVSPDGTVSGGNGVPVEVDDPNNPGETIWVIKGKTTVKKITDTHDPKHHFTRIYGRETGRRMADGTHVVRPGFDSNIAADNRLEPNEFESYKITYDTRNAAWPVTVKYKVYFLKKGASGKFPTGTDGFYETSTAAQDPVTKKKLAIFNVFEKEVTIDQ